MLRSLVLVLPLVLAFALAACNGEPDLGPPPGWEGEGTERWWQSGTDTSVAFRDLSGFESFGLSDREDGLRSNDPTVRNIQRRFLPMYRNHPEVVDSLFGAVLQPIIEREATPGAETEEREALMRRLNRRMHDHFYPAQPRRGQEPISVPDSLREAGVAGTINLQIFLDADGRPEAIEKLEGIHPTMDAIVMRNYTQREWQPAHLQGRPIASWIRTGVTIGS
jgi:hypothetical protein